jgi:hypothetical protein
VAYTFPKDFLSHSLRHEFKARKQNHNNNNNNSPSVANKNARPASGTGGDNDVRQKLEPILKKDVLQSLSQSERDFLWQHRAILSQQYPTALSKFLISLPWTNPDAVQVHASLHPS